MGTDKSFHPPTPITHKLQVVYDHERTKDTVKKGRRDRCLRVRGIG